MRESERVSVPVLRRKRPGVGIDKMKCVTVGDKLRCSGKVGGVRFVRPMCEEVCVSVRVCVRACVHARAVSARLCLCLCVWSVSPRGRLPQAFVPSVRRVRFRV